MADLDLKQFLNPPIDDPEINADLHKFLEIEEVVLGRKHDRFLELTEHADIDKRKEEFLWYYLAERGWELRLDLTERQQRRLLKHIIEINKGRGTTDTIIFTVKLLYNIDLDFQFLNHKTLGYWVVGYSRVGIDTKVGSAEDRITKILLIYDGVLDSATKEAIKKIAEYLRNVTQRYLFSWKKDETIDLDRYWKVGYSYLGSTTKIN